MYCHIATTINGQGITLFKNIAYSTLNRYDQRPEIVIILSQDGNTAFNLTVTKI